MNVGGGAHAPAAKARRSRLDSDLSGDEVKLIFILSAV